MASGNTGLGLGNVGEDGEKTSRRINVHELLPVTMRGRKCLSEGTPAVSEGPRWQHKTLRQHDARRSTACTTEGFFVVG